MSSSFDPLPFLRSLPIFSSWDEDSVLKEALTDLADRAEVWTYRGGDLVRFPDEAPPGPGWVAEGCLVVLEAESPRYVGVRESWDSPTGVWIRGQTSGRFVTIPEASWRAWLRTWPTASERLGEQAPPKLPRSLYRSPLVLEPGETPRHLFRKAPLFLALRVALPLAFFLLFLSFGLVLQFGLAPPVPFWALWLLPGLGMLVTAALMTLVTWEWSSSVLAITDRAVILKQTDVWAQHSDFEKLALERLREAVFVRQGWFDALLGLVALEVEGDSPKGRLVFKGLSRDSRFLEAMESLRLQRMAISTDRRAIRRSLADRAGGAKAPRLERPAARVERPGPRVRRLSWRVEKDGVVWFRRHPWFVARRSLPWMGWLALVFFLAFLAFTLWPQGGWPLMGATLLVSLLPLGRLIWEIWDWADDRLSLQGDKIVMVHRRPLWLGEVRQEGNLDRVEQVGVRKNNLAALVLDFGTVTVSLGAADQLIFEDASHPEWVQNEIFHRRTVQAQDRERRSAQTRLDEVSEILDTWDEARKAGYFSTESEAKERP